MLKLRMAVKIALLAVLVIGLPIGQRSVDNNDEGSGE